MYRSKKVKPSSADSMGITPSHELLLKASVLKTKEAISAWEDFKKMVDIDSIDPASLRVLPLLYRNLLFLKVDDTQMNRLKGVYRLAWYKNQILFHRMRSVLKNFHEAGIKTMILKGVALSLMYYKDLGVRPMADFDVMVRSRDFHSAVRLLRSAGWSEFNTRPLNELTKKVRHAHGFRDASGNEFDLHWHLLVEFCTDDSDADFWESSAAFEFQGIPTAVLSHTDNLFHTLVHGAEWNAVTPLRWLADAAVIIDQVGSEIDWQRLASLAKARSLSLALGKSLRCLDRILGLSIPEEVMRRIEATPVSRLEERAYHAKMRSYGFMGVLKADYLRYLIYGGAGSDGALFDSPAAFIHFLRHYWGKEHIWQLPPQMFLKTLKRIRS